MGTRVELAFWNFHRITGKQPPPYRLLTSRGLWGKTFNLVQKPPPKIDFGIGVDTVAQSTYGTREPCSFAFLHLSIRGNSQGPIKIKIYNLYNILHQRHLLVIFFLNFILTVGRGVCVCVDEMGVLVCYVTVAALSAVY